MGVTRYRFSSEQTPQLNAIPPTSKLLFIFRDGSGAAPDAAGEGYLIDRVKLTSGDTAPVPSAPPTATGVNYDGSRTPRFLGLVSWLRSDRLLLSLGLGALIRKTAGAITAIVGILFVLPVLSSFLPSSMEAIQKYLPSNAAQAILTGSSSAGDDVLSAWLGLGVFFLYAAAALAAAAFTLVHRDA